MSENLVQEKKNPKIPIKLKKERKEKKKKPRNFYYQSPSHN